MQLFLGAKMAQRIVQLDEENLSCSICLEQLKDPVTIPCGHSYCMNCIRDHWDGEDQRRNHSCPQCRKEFIPRPELVKNIMLAALVEDLKKTGLQTAAADHCYAGPEDVACDVCTGRKMKAVKTCLVCLISYCENHLQPHYESPAFKKHKLVNPTKTLMESICSCHDEVMKMLMDGYETISAEAERAEKQKELQESQQQIHQRIQDQEKDVKLLQQEVEAINVSADKAVEDSEKIFTELIRLLQKRSSDVKQQIRSQQETEMSRVKDVQEKLEQEITELKRKDAELEQLSHTEDHIQFLLNYPSLPALSESTHSSSINIRPLRHFEDVTAAVSELRDIMQDILRDTWRNIKLKITEVEVLLSETEPKTRREFLQYFQELTLDPNTAHKKLLLSEENRKCKCIRQEQSYPDHPDRFSDHKQALSRESLTGRCYWEVEWTGRLVGVGVSYKDTSRTEVFGQNDKSWCLYCDLVCNVFYHNNVVTSLPSSDFATIGVYLDHRAGILSFYSISKTMTLIHRVQTRFTQPLYAGITPMWFGSSAEFIKPK
ncbi:tripartite motif-containing protein 16-like isoform X1 [Xiphophorus couchianus]|uniref:tripartite motif-containing protein 16-like isoform X1 n=1 Tax=Xiphophorus couchianus TaxID=32473 RepID=UPI001016EBED|nr:tripartite motif-containing protein 16-like isoform X1 [Xiphophorus couchianus]XP_027893329.1 tripartite motif-containing protein 16-like isoform X1 [Xiphophorus couchianus]XP_027893331.1 tripartite motif-containing protein 16-like isoform X1 [Xiphophorus couchianus]